MEYQTQPQAIQYFWGRPLAQSVPSKAIASVTEMSCRTTIPSKLPITSSHTYTLLTICPRFVDREPHRVGRHIVLGAGGQRGPHPPEVLVSVAASRTVVSTLTTIHIPRSVGAAFALLTTKFAARKRTRPWVRRCCASAGAVSLAVGPVLLVLSPI